MTISNSEQFLKFTAFSSLYIHNGVILLSQTILQYFYKLLIWPISYLSQIILQYFYKLLIWPTSYLFSSRLTINITFLFINNYSPYQPFVKYFVKKFVYLILLFQNPPNGKREKGPKSWRVHYSTVKFALPVKHFMFTRLRMQK